MLQAVLFGLKVGYLADIVAVVYSMSYNFGDGSDLDVFGRMTG